MWIGKVCSVGVILGERAPNIPWIRKIEEAGVNKKALSHPLQPSFWRDNC